LILRVPKSLRKSANQNIENFIRDIACYPRTGIRPFIRRRVKINESIKTFKNPFNPGTMKFDSDFKCNNSFRRFMHIDLAKNRDAVGISMSHVPYFVDREDLGVFDGRTRRVKAPVVKIDFWGRIAVRKGEEIVLGDIRELVYELSRRGFYFGLITFDRFQSLDSIQILKSYGYVCANLSVDRTAYILKVTQNKDGYVRISTEGGHNYAQSCLRDLLYDDRLLVPATHFHYDRDWFVEECKQAQETKTGKVDHPPKGTIDVMQSVAGSVTNCIVNERMVIFTESEAEMEENEDEYYKNTGEIDSFLMNVDSLYQYSQDPRDI